MGCFDTHKIPCPYCNSLVEEQVKPGWMNTYTFGDDPEKDMDFAGWYNCYTCHRNFTVEMETVPRMVVKKAEE